MATPLAANYRTLSSISRIDLLHMLMTRGTLSVDELAEATGLHANTTREHLHRLIDAGFVRSETLHKDSRGRPRLLYTAVTDPDDPHRAERVKQAFERADQVRRLVSPATASEPVSAADRQLDLLEDHMDECGFDASVDADELRLTVHECPYDKLAADHPQVCQVHYGLLSASIDQIDGPLEASELHARDPHTGCWVRLRQRDRNNDAAEAS
ncbi:helix-turn-helix transcriptional regulator [Paramicrobacterium humi]|nr:helix-turn-helix domain-containing protein [Microbacterium humi]